MGLLTVSGLVAGYSSADMILKGVDLEVDAGEIVCIIGPNGAGKSTLLKAIAGLLRVGSGAVRLGERAITGLAAREVARAGVAFVPQEANVFPTLSIRENLEIGGYVEPARTRARIEAAFARFPLLAERRRAAARTLSGGQRQILAIAMALMVEPQVLMLDEPSAGLSPVAADQLFATIREVQRDGVAIALVEQNALQALALSDRAYILVDGRNARTGPAAEIAADPATRKAFLGG
ncbi:MAG: ABC transporter ATP-binding protein [Alphaproteobacteria bacterium]